MAENTPGLPHAWLTARERERWREEAGETGSQSDNADILFEMQDTGRGVLHLARHSVCMPLKPGQAP